MSIRAQTVLSVLLFALLAGCTSPGLAMQARNRSPQSRAEEPKRMLSAKKGAAREESPSLLSRSGRSQSSDAAVAGWSWFSNFPLRRIIGNPGILSLHGTYAA